MLDLVVAHDHRRIAGGERVGEVPGGDPRGLGIDEHLQPVERVVGRIGLDRRATMPGHADSRSCQRSSAAASRSRTPAWSRLAQASSAAIAPAMPSLPTFMPRPMPWFCRQAARTSSLRPATMPAVGPPRNLCAL